MRALGAAGFVNPARDRIYCTPEDPHMNVRGMVKLQIWNSSCRFAAVYPGSKSLVSALVV